MRIDNCKVQNERHSRESSPRDLTTFRERTVVACRIRLRGCFASNLQFAFRNYQFPIGIHSEPSL